MKITLTERQILDMMGAAIRDKKHVTYELVEAYRTKSREISVNEYQIKELKQLAWTEYCLALEIKSEFSEQYMDLYRYLKSKEEEHVQKVLQYLG